MAAMLQFCNSMAKRMMSSHRSSAFFSTSSSSSMVSSSAAAPVVCGRGDKKTKRGKRFKGSYGNSRPKKKQMIERLKEKLEVPRSTPWPLPFKLI